MIMKRCKNQPKSKLSNDIEINAEKSSKLKCPNEMLICINEDSNAVMKMSIYYFRTFIYPVNMHHWRVSRSGTSEELKGLF